MKNAKTTLPVLLYDTLWYIHCCQANKGLNISWDTLLDSCLDFNHDNWQQIYNKEIQLMMQFKWYIRSDVSRNLSNKYKVKHVLDLCNNFVFVNSSKVLIQSNLIFIKYLSAETAPLTFTEEEEDCWRLICAVRMLVSPPGAKRSQR